MKHTNPRTTTKITTSKFADTNIGGTDVTLTSTDKQRHRSPIEPAGSAAIRLHVREETATNWRFAVHILRGIVGIRDAAQGGPGRLSKGTGQ
ncbi:hypothetical protein GFY24_11485 [Nocardia sp. SYP-A9097]|uniref:hypothetical protein n=1 Tax=Nocardia sp. SYP-A9097 TaxID=2663237 RepID=UPI00129B97E1|nr:hypothetical protein [Nocardia sp. SYP-A9097]MRH88058.1 hypothetical protein [Nocardia sp. SYP-A9097]